MKRNLLILAAFVLATVALPVEVTVASESSGQVAIGAWMKTGAKTQVGMVSCPEGSIVQDTSRGYRISYVLPIARTFETNETTALGLMIQGQKYFSLGKHFTPYILGAAGPIAQSKEGEDKVTNNFKAEIGIHIYKSLAVGATGYWMPQEGPDNVFTGVSLKLLKPIQ